MNFSRLPRGSAACWALNQVRRLLGSPLAQCHGNWGWLPWAGGTAVVSAVEGGMWLVVGGWEGGRQDRKCISVPGLL